MVSWIGILLSSRCRIPHINGIIYQFLTRAYHREVWGIVRDIRNSELWHGWKLRFTMSIEWLFLHSSEWNDGCTTSCCPWKCGGWTVKLSCNESIRSTNAHESRLEYACGRHWTQRLRLVGPIVFGKSRQSVSRFRGLILHQWRSWCSLPTISVIAFIG